MSIRTSLRHNSECVGADRFVAWVDNVLYKEVPNEKKFKLDKEDFDFKIFQSPLELEQEIRKLNDQEKEPRLRLVLWQAGVGIGRASAPPHRLPAPPSGPPDPRTVGGGGNVHHLIAAHGGGGGIGAVGAVGNG